MLSEVSELGLCASQIRCLVGSCRDLFIFAVVGILCSNLAALHVESVSNRFKAEVAPDVDPICLDHMTLPITLPMQKDMVAPSEASRAVLSLLLVFR